jgi:hypothetical protein
MIKLSTKKFYKFLRSTTFILVVFSYEIILNYFYKLFS